MNYVYYGLFSCVDQIGPQKLLKPMYVLKDFGGNFKLNVLFEVLVFPFKIKYNPTPKGFSLESLVPHGKWRTLNSTL